jgi:hypothetical protein
MIGLKSFTFAAIISMGVVTSASAQLPDWAISHPDAFQAQYPDRDVLNGGALTPAARMGLELPGGAAPVFQFVGRGTQITAYFVGCNRPLAMLLVRAEEVVE